MQNDINEFRHDLRFILQRKSIRKFKNKKIKPEILNLLIEAGQRAPSAGNMQPYSFIIIKDNQKREKLYELSWNQECVKGAPLLLYICVDLRRNARFIESLGGRSWRGEGIGKLLFPIIDASLAAENIIIAAESMGLGSVAVGTPTGYPEDVSNLLELPEGVYPLFLLCIGYADESPSPRYRWDSSEVVHDDVYSDVKDSGIQKYAHTITEKLQIDIKSFINKMKNHYSDEILSSTCERMNHFFR